MTEQLRALIVEDSEDDAALILRELRRGGYKPVYERVDTRDAFNTALEQKAWDIIISDYTMPQFKGTEALEILKLKGVDIPFIFVSGTIGEDRAVEAMKNGAHDYVIKGNLKRLPPAVERELRDAEVRRARKKAEDHVHHLAYYDILTNLPNRVLLYDRIQQAIVIEKRENSSFALLIMDLDRFKEINSTLGHNNGDLLLKQVGCRMEELLREAYTIARLGGAEFAIVLLKSDSDSAIEVAKKIQERLEKPFLLSGLSLDVSASIGIALYPGHGEDAVALVQHADTAMYKAKETKNSIVVYSPNYDKYSTKHLALMGELRHAIDEGQLFLLYQPKIDIRTGRAIGVEALARWKHPKNGVIPPDQFIALAEHTGSIKQLTFWVIKEALRQSRGWQQAGIDISVAVNLSVRNLQTPHLLEHITGMLSTWGVASSSLRLEITESIIMADPVLAREVIKQLTEMGMRFSIDDFGTGYSSLSYLQRLPVDELKIDKSFVMNMMKDENSNTIVGSIIELAHSLGLKVVAEGVESKEILDRLAIAGCDVAQGYYISKPISHAEITAWLNKQA